MATALPTPPADGSDVWGAELNQAITDLINAAIASATANVAAGASLGDVVLSAKDVKGNTVSLTQKVGGAPFVLQSALGARSGVAQLDAAGQLPLGQAGNVTYQSVGAAAVNHTHALADLPSVAKAIDASPAMAVFNTATKAWPIRSSLTQSPTRTVIYFGDAALPSDALPGVDIYFGPATNGGTVTAPTTPTPPTSDPDPVTGITMAVPTVVVNGSLYNITALFTNGSTAQTYTYLQLAVRGPDGTAYDTGYAGGSSLAAAGTLTLTGSGTAPAAGVYTAKISYNIAGGTDQASWIDGPVASFTIASTGGAVTPPAGGSVGTRTIPLIGRSGLPWNSGVFFNGGDVNSANSFATWRGRKLDSIMYFVGWNTSDQTQVNYLNPSLTAWPGYRIVSVPPQVSSFDNNYAAGSSGTAFWTAWGKMAHNAGWDDGRTIVRLAWEANGGWYPWSWVDGGATLFVNMYKNVVNSIRIGAPKMLFDLTMNRGNVTGGINWKTDIYGPLLNYFDIIGLDSYDAFPAQNTTSGFNSAIAQDPGPSSIAAYCRTVGKMMWFNEWGLTHRSDGPSGGDDPNYIISMWNFFQANSDVLAGETYYEDPGTESDNGQLSTGLNPNGAAAYRDHSRWGGTGA